MRTLAAAWAVVGLSAVLVDAASRLAKLSLLALEFDWNAGHWAAFALNTVFMAWSEGYRGFQQNFSPRCAARTLYLHRNAGLVSGLLAPLFIVGYFGAERRTRIVAWVGTIAIVILVILVRALPQPWRGIIDFGVVVGLSWGLASFWYMVWRAFSDSGFDWSPGVPASNPR